jgi:hypothetical protein
VCVAMKPGVTVSHLISARSSGRFRQSGAVPTGQDGRIVTEGRDALKYRLTLCNQLCVICTKYISPTQNGEVYVRPHAIHKKLLHGFR